MRYQHVTFSEVVPNDVAPGGTWRVECLCGWTDGGTYARSTPMALHVAERLGEAFGKRHAEEPEEGNGTDTGLNGPGSRTVSEEFAGAEVMRCTECGEAVDPLQVVIHLRTFHGIEEDTDAG